jgi:hypothetical protein
LRCHAIVCNKKKREKENMFGEGGGRLYTRFVALVVVVMMVVDMIRREESDGCVCVCVSDDGVCTSCVALQKQQKIMLYEYNK